MKNLIFGAGILLCLIPLSLAVLFRMEEKRCRSALDAALSAGVYQSLENAYTVPCYEIRSDEELAADAIRHVIMRVRSGDMEVKIWKSDLEIGILDLEVRIFYRFPLTESFTVSSRCCGLRDQK